MTVTNEPDSSSSDENPYSKDETSISDGDQKLAAKDKSKDTPLSQEEQEVALITQQLEKAKAAAALSKQAKEQAKVQTKVKEEWQNFLKYCNLTAEGINILDEKIGITSIEELQDIGDNDDTKLLVSQGLKLLKARRIQNLATYSFLGGEITDNLTSQEIASFIKENRATDTGSPYQERKKEPEEYMAKAEVDVIEEFSNNPEDFEEYWKTAIARLGATTAGTCIDAPPDPKKVQLVAYNQQLYFILYNAFKNTTVESDIAKVRDKHGPDGHATAQAILSYYRSRSIKSDVQQTLRDQLAAITLEGDPQDFSVVGEYLNDWHLTYNKLEDAGEKWDDTKKRDQFLKGIKLDRTHPVSTIKVTMSTNSKLTYDGAYKMVDTVARQNCKGEDKAVKTTRRNTNNESGGERRNDSKEIIPRFAPWLIPLARKKSDSNEVINLFQGWKFCYNKTGRQPTEAEVLASNLNFKNQGFKNRKKNHTQGSKRNASNSGRDNGKHKKTRRTKVMADADVRTRKTTTVATGVPEVTAKVTIKDASIEAQLSSDSDEGNDQGTKSNNDDNGTPADQSVSFADGTKPALKSALKSSKKNKAAKKRKTKTRRLRKQPDGSYKNELVTRRAAAGEHHLIFDSGTEAEIVGGNGWITIGENEPDRFETIGGYFPGSTSHRLPYSMAVTVYDHPTRGPILLGVAQAPYDEDKGLTESVLNPNFIGHFIDIDERAETRGGRQSIIFDNELEAPLLVDPVKCLPYIKVRPPTEEEITNLDTVWLVPPGAERGNQVKKTRRNPVLEQPPQAKLTERLANCPQATADKTLETTTLYCGEDAAIEQREIPRKQMQRRLHPIHNKRLPGRTDTDTVFVAEKSVRGFTCFQLFTHLLTQFLFIALMRKESESHGAYQDYIRDVGIPNHIHSDNAQTETGEKWTRTSRQNRTRQTQSTPHHQHQNFAERKVGQIKPRLSYTMFASQAPLVMWCYCLEFLTECLNVTGKRGLRWQTPMTLMTGNTSDLSKHRFRFWEPVWYYESTAKFPEATWKPGYHLGFAKDVGDPFTYKVWTCDKDGNWENGGELTRNMLIRRQTSDTPPTEVPIDDSAVTQLKMESARVKRKTKTRKSQDSRSKAVRDKKAAMAATGKRKKSSVVHEEPQTKLQKQLELDGITIATAELTEGESTNPAELSHLTSAWNRTPQEIRLTGGGINTTVDSDDVSTISLEDDITGDEIYSDFDPTSTEIGDILAIEKHKWDYDQLKFLVMHHTEEATWHTFYNLKLDVPRMLAQYMVKNNVSRTKRDPKLQWAKKTIKDLDKACRRVARLYHLSINDNDEVVRVRRTIKGNSKKKKRIDYTKKRYHYGVEIPRTVADAKRLDEQNGNTLWMDSLKLEMDTLIDYECFEFHQPGTTPPKGYQPTRLHIVFDCKHDGRRKSRCVAGGHLVDVPKETETYSSQVKPLSVKLIGVIAHKQGLKQLCGDISNAYINAECSEKVYVARAGPEFGDKEGMLVVIMKALYGLSASGADWHRHFSNSLRSYGFTPTRYDKDAWIRLAESKDHYEYITTHVDDFKITAKDPQVVMDLIEAEYKVKGAGPPDYYLGNDYKEYKGSYAVGSKRYIKEALRRVKETFGELPKKENIPMDSKIHPEDDVTPVLDDENHRRYQMLIGMLNWAVTIGRFDIAHATSSLARFSSAPREGHLRLALKVFGYLRVKPNRRILIDSRDPIITGVDLAEGDEYARKLREYYPDAAEEIDVNLPEPLVPELMITAFVDSDHGHDHLTRRSITGLIILVGRTPVFYMSKRQGAIATSTYSAEFAALRTASEETAAMRHSLRGLGVKVESTSLVMGDNLGVIQQATLKESLLKKKHTAISYHQVREATAAGIILPAKIHTHDNYSDFLTKNLPYDGFTRLTGGLFYG